MLQFEIFQHFNPSHGETPTSFFTRYLADPKTLKIPVESSASLSHRDRHFTQRPSEDDRLVTPNFPLLILVKTLDATKLIDLFATR